MSRQIIDQDHRDRAWQCFDKNISVEAGAGTGKTRVLVDRYLAWTLAHAWPEGNEKKSSAGSIVAITFTEKAAGEMQQRVIRSLRIFADLSESRLKEKELNYVKELRGSIANHWQLTEEQVRDRARALLNQSHRIEVSTIHAFAKQLLHTWPLEAGIHPDFRSGDTKVERKRIIERALYKQVREGLAGDRATDYIELLNRLQPESLTNVIVALVDSNFDGRFAPPAVHETLIEDCRWLADALLEIRPTVAAGSIPKLNRTCDSLQLLADALTGHGDALKTDPRGCLEENGLEAMEGVKTELGDDYPKDRMRKKLGDKADEFAARATKVRNSVQETIRNDHYCFALVVELFAELISESQRLFRVKGLLSHDDLLFYAARLIQDNRHVARALSERYSQILVDEFQDTSSEQCDILRGIVEYAPETPRLFVVGDAKQSIYSFRNAELKAYTEFIEELRTLEELKLSTCFRAQRALVDTMNAAFCKLFIPDTGVQPPPQDLWGYHDPLGLTAVQLVDLDGMKDLRGSEADAIIRAIVKIREENPVDSGRDWSRFGVLSRVQTKASVLMTKLEKAGIPAVVSGDKDFYRKQEVIDAFNLLRVIHNNHDGVAWVGLLRSPIGACPDGLLVVLAEAAFFTSGNQPAAVESALESPGPYKEHLMCLKRLVVTLQNLREALMSEPISIWPERLYCALPLTALYASQQVGERCAANFRRVIQSFCEAMVSGTQAIGEWLAEAQESVMSGVEESESALADDTTDAVRVMSIHGAKGLEWEHVFVIRTDWGGLGNLPDKRANVLQTDGGWVLDVAGYHSHGKQAYDNEQAVIDKAELVRLLYVACTRAEKSLTVMGKFKKGGMSALIRSGFRDLVGVSIREMGAEAFCADTQIPSANAVGHDADHLVADAPTLWNARYQMAKKRRLALVTASDLMKAEKEESDGAYKQGSGSSDAMALGNEVHGLLELWIHKKMDLTGAGSQAKSIVEGFLASDLVDRVWGAKQRFAEMPFIMTPEQGEVAFGSIDLLMEEEGGWTVVDYKSNRVSTQQEAEEEALGYTLQGELYVKAVERALGISGVRCELWFVRGPFVVSMP